MQFNMSVLPRGPIVCICQSAPTWSQTHTLAGGEGVFCCERSSRFRKTVEGTHRRWATGAWSPCCAAASTERQCTSPPRTGWVWHEPAPEWEGWPVCPGILQQANRAVARETLQIRPRNRLLLYSYMPPQGQERPSVQALTAWCILPTMMRTNRTVVTPAVM